jgi:hypothetical protein
LTKKKAEEKWDRQKLRNCEVNKKPRRNGIDKKILLFYLWNVYLSDHDVSWLSGRWEIYALCHKPLKNQKNELHLTEKLIV